MLSNEEKILANSRLTVINSRLVPVMMGCLVLSGVYFSSAVDYSNIFFGWTWAIIAMVALLKRNKDAKRVVEATE